MSIPFKDSNFSGSSKGSTESHLTLTPETLLIASSVGATRRCSSIEAPIQPEDVRYVEYSENYMADHWCEKGHIVYCLQGEVINELKDGSQSILKEGMSYIVSDDLSSHRSGSKNGVHLLIIDGDFLKLNA